MLQVILSYGNTYAEAITDAVSKYNSFDGDKIFHDKSVYLADIDVNGILYKYGCEIWFTLHTRVQIPEQFEFVGSHGVDPNDPNWREKLSLNNNS